MTAGRIRVSTATKFLQCRMMAPAIAGTSHWLALEQPLQRTVGRLVDETIMLPVFTIMPRVLEGPCLVCT